MRNFFLFTFAFLCCNVLFGQNIYGVVVDSASQEVLEFVNIADLNSYKGTITNSEGYFELDTELPTTLKFSFLGYDSKIIQVNSPQDVQNLKIELISSSLFVEEIVMEAEKLNLGRDIIKKVIENKKNRLVDNTFQCEVYQQTKMTKVFKPQKSDSIQTDSIAIVYLNEVAATHDIQGNKFKRTVNAEIKQAGDPQLNRTVPMTTGRDFKGGSRFVTYNPIEYFVTPQDFNIDIYDNSFNNKTLTDRPITSPIATGALLNYTYRLKKIDLTEDKDSIFTIAVRPRFKEAPLWEGTVYVSSKGFQLMKADLNFDPGINGFKEFKLQINYNDIEGQHVATEKKITYEARIGKNPYYVQSTYRTSEYNFEPDFKRGHFTAEQVKYTEEALKPNTDLMLKFRGVALEKDLKVFFNEQDSIYRSITSDEYLEERDSIFNSITWRKVLLEGIGRRNRSKGITYTFSGLVGWVQVFGVDGFRISPSGSFEKEFPNSNEISVGYGLDYGLQNNDLKGRLNLNYLFLPQKFARFYVGGGDIFDFITFFQSLDAIVSRTNFIRNRFVNAGYSMELVNGLYFNSKVEYSDKESVIDLKPNRISEFLFGSQESAFDFDRYRIFSLELDLIYRFGQKFMTRGRKKIVLPNYNPVLTLKYRKGIPGIGNSEVNFDYLELKANQKLPATKLGSLNWQARAGTFVNTKNIRQLEYNFFRGSTNWIFTNPLNDLQQIGVTRSTPGSFLQAGAIHHFNGFFLDKVPLLNKLQMELLTGAGTLIIPDNNLYHAEIYLGLGKKFRIWGETIQVACYAVTSDNNLSKADVEFKFGLNFYNAFAREWLY